MKKKFSSQSAFFNFLVLTGLFIVLAGIFLALLGFGGFSNVFAQPKISTIQPVCSRSRHSRNFDTGRDRLGWP
jgi:hypothetical protein